MNRAHAITLRLKKGVKHRILQGHPWVYQSELTDLPPADSTWTASLLGTKGEFLGSGIYNPASQISFRRHSRQESPLSRDLLYKKISQAIQFRLSHPQLQNTQALRLIWSEADELPGLIVDQYKKSLVIQTLTRAMGEREQEIVDLLSEITKAETVIARNDVRVRTIEGLPMDNSILRGNYTPPTQVTSGLIDLEIDLMTGQKTGTYLDQWHNHVAVAQHAKNRRVMDCFSYQGGFALACLKAGATSCIAVDQSESALDLARKSAERNQLNLSTRHGNAFDILRQMEKEHQFFDLIILDPPSFTKNKSGMDAAERGYHELHLRSLKLLSPGGLLATFTCSHHTSASDWLSVAVNAANDIGCSLRVLQTYQQRADHPILAEVPETSYLSGYLFEKR